MLRAEFTAHELLDADGHNAIETPQHWDAYQ